MKIVVLEKETEVDGVLYSEGSVVQVHDDFNVGRVRKTIKGKHIKVKDKK